MKIIYLMEWELKEEDGVIKKVLNQINKWKELGNDVKLIILSKCDNNIKFDNTDITIIKKNRLNIFMNNPLIKIITTYNPNVIYFRYSAYKPYLNKILKTYPVIIELNTNIKGELNINKSFKNRLKYFYIIYTNKYLLNNVAGIVSVTYEIINTLAFKKRTIVLPNSIKMLNENDKNNNKNKNELPSLIFIGTPNQKWQGTDKIIELAKKTEGILTFNVIGEEKPSIEITKNIKFHGFLNKIQYDNIVKKSNIGIGTLSLHEKNMEEACPLKVREYLSYGLPIIIGYEDTAFIHEEKEWILKVGNTEKNVVDNINKIIEFSIKNKDLVLKNQEVEEYIDVEVIEKKRLSFFKEFLNNEIN